MMDDLVKIGFSACDPARPVRLFAFFVESIVCKHIVHFSDHPLPTSAAKLLTKLSGF